MYLSLAITLSERVIVGMTNTQSHFIYYLLWFLALPSPVVGMIHTTVMEWLNTNVTLFCEFLFDIFKGVIWWFRNTDWSANFRKHVLICRRLRAYWWLDNIWFHSCCIQQHSINGETERCRRHLSLSRYTFVCIGVHIYTHLNACIYTER